MSTKQLSREQARSLDADIEIRIALQRIMIPTSYEVLALEYGRYAGSLRYIVENRRQPDTMSDADYQRLLRCAAQYAAAAKTMDAGYRTKRLMAKYGVSRTTIWRHTVLVMKRRRAQNTEWRKAA